MNLTGHLYALTIVAATFLFAACDSSPSGPSSGDLRVEISGLPTGTLAAVTVAGPNGFARTIAASETLSELPSATYSVTASLVSASGESFGAVSPNQTVSLSSGGATATVEYVSLRSALSVSVTGLPSGTAGSVRVEGDGGFARTMSASGLIAALAPGTYTVIPIGVVAGDSSYQATPAVQQIEVTATSAAVATVQYRAVAHRTFNMSITAMYLVQAVQTLDRLVPIVAAREAYLRVFGRGDQLNTATPSLRVRLYQGTTLVSTFDEPLAGTSIPTAISQAAAEGNWTIRIPAHFVQPGLRVQVDLDPYQSVAEAVENDNQYPVDGAPLQMVVQVVPPLRIRLIPILQVANGLVGNLSEANKSSYLTTTRKIYPVAEVDADVRSTYTVNGPAFDQDGNVWSSIVSELDAVRVAEGSGRYYYGVVKTEYRGGGVIGIAAGIPSRTALGWDRFPDAPNTVAHELGHNFGRRHIPCGGTAGNDPEYPYPTGMIGSFGMDTETRELKTPTEFTDIMGYCDAKWWISDYTFTSVLNHRAQADAGMFAGGSETSSLLIWGRIVDGVPILEPAFRIVTRPSLPTAPGPYQIEGRDGSGTRLFSLSFDGQRVEHLPGDQRIFSFALPITAETAARLASISLTAEGRSVTSQVGGLGPPGVRSRVVPFEGATVTEQGGESVEVRWDSSIHPTVMVREPNTREVLGFVRGGTGTIHTSAPELELVASDGVLSNTRRVRVQGL